MAVNRKHVAIAATSGAVLAAAVALVTPLEGVITHPYYDSVHVLTWCIGETEGPHKAQYTVAECKAMLLQRLPEYDEPMMQCIGHEIPDSVHVAFLSVTYNIGIAGFCRSSMARDAAAGDYSKACEDLKGWWRAGNHPTLLKSRREIERKKCREDVDHPQVKMSPPVLAPAPVVKPPKSTPLPQPAPRAIPATSPKPTLWERVKGWFK